MNESLSIRTPKNVTFKDVSDTKLLGMSSKNINPNFYDYSVANDGKFSEFRKYQSSNGYYPHVAQRRTLINGDQHDMLIREVQQVGMDDNGSLYKSIEVLDNQGNRSVTRLIDGKVVDTREFPALNRKFATKGMKAKLEKLALKIGTDANGCERPVLRRIGGFIFDIAKKTK